MATATVKMDPRMLARRVAVERAVGRRRLWWLLATLVLLLVAIGAYAVTRSSVLDVDTIEVSGNATHVDVDAVLADQGVVVGAQMTDLDLNAVVDALAQSPWVREARIERHWPGSVEVSVYERRAAATAVTASGEMALVADDGVILEHRAAPPDDAALVSVPSLDLSSAELAHLVRASSAVTADLLPWISVIEPKGENVEIALIGGVRAVLGDGLEFSDELQSLGTVLSRVDLTCVAVIDVSSHQTPVVTRDQTCEAGAS